MTGSSSRVIEKLSFFFVYVNSRTRSLRGRELYLASIVHQSHLLVDEFNTLDIK